MSRLPAKQDLYICDIIRSRRINGFLLGARPAKTLRPFVSINGSFRALKCEVLNNLRPSVLRMFPLDLHRSKMT